MKTAPVGFQRSPAPGEGGCAGAGVQGKEAVLGLGSGGCGQHALPAWLPAAWGELRRQTRSPPFALGIYMSLEGLGRGLCNQK